MPNCRYAMLKIEGGKNFLKRPQIHGTFQARKKRCVIKCTDPPNFSKAKINLAFGQIKRGRGTPPPFDNHDYQWGKASPSPLNLTKC